MDLGWEWDVPGRQGGTELTRKPSWQTRTTRKHAENCSNSTWKQVDDLFEVMQQPSAPSGEW